MKSLDQVLELVYGLAPWVEPTLLLVPNVLGTWVAVLANRTGLEASVVQMSLGLFLAYPLGLVMNALPFGRPRHVFSAVGGLFLLQFTLGVQWIHPLMTIFVAHVLLRQLSGRRAVVVVPVFAMTYLLCGHGHRQYTNPLGYDMDFTGAQMVLTQKLIMLVYNLWDGECLRKKGDKANRTAKKLSAVALYEVPSLIEYLGYCFCFSGLLVGPAMEFALYRDACEGRNLYDTSGKPRGKIPSNVWPTLRPLLTSLVAVAAYIILDAQFPLLDPDDPQGGTPIVLTPAFLARPMLYRLVYLWLTGGIYRQRYYFGWKNAEGALNIWYAGFEGFDEQGNPKGWKNSNNVDIYQSEIAASDMKKLTNVAWNRLTGQWLKRYVYYRTGGSLAATYGMSALWHGFYPGYGLAFLSLVMVTYCERLGQERISPHLSKTVMPPGLYSVVTWLLWTVLLRTYIFSAFALLSFDRCWKNWKSLYFFGHVGALIFYIVVSLCFPSSASSHLGAKKKDQ